MFHRNSIAAAAFFLAAKVIEHFFNILFTFLFEKKKIVHNFAGRGTAS
jgi:hypothetical protein